MPATVKLRLLNLLDGPADMIVLPCSTGGTVTGFVARSLSKYSILHRRVGMPLGDVEILPFEGGENMAQHVAFAASVKAMTSSLEAIESIGVKLGDFTTKDSSARVLAAPLLGAGAGGLQGEKVVAALKTGFERSAHRDACLIVYVLRRIASYDCAPPDRRKEIFQPAITVFGYHSIPELGRKLGVKDWSVYDGRAKHTSPSKQGVASQLMRTTQRVRSSILNCLK